MGTQLPSSYLFLLTVSLALHWINAASSAADSTSSLYIVYMGERQHDDPDLVTASHHDMLTSLLGSVEKTWRYSIDSVTYSTFQQGESSEFNRLQLPARLLGFCGYPYTGPSKANCRAPGVISVELSRTYEIQTTRSWDFLGMDVNQPTGLLRKVKYGEGAVIGIIDTGIWPESSMLDDRGYGPIPTRWKGKCKLAKTFGVGNCSRKLIGARWYTGGADEADLKGEYMSPRDINGHGTHTATTTSGSLVGNSSYNGLAVGTVRGGAPHARLAIYKVCWGPRGRCSSAAVIKAIDDAIHDGVDVLSLSLGGDGYPSASIHAVSRGIPVIFAGGNDGPAPQTVENTLPWVITVAASTIDRSFPMVITLGDGQKLVGQSLSSGESKFRDIVEGGRCDEDTFNGSDVTGVFVFCYSPSEVATFLPRVELSNVLSVVRNTGAKGLIYSQYTISILDFYEACGDMICVAIDYEMASRIQSYIAGAARVPKVKVSPARTIIGSEVWSPRVGAFSSRGPSPAFPELIKPDIAAPGISIMASYRPNFKLILLTGTSMATPHVAGIVALLKLLHPDWSPAAIKSAIITTASTTDIYGIPIKADGLPRKIADPFDYGGGNINPNRASDPGLVYDSNPMDYVKLFNCTFGISEYCYKSSRPLYDINLPSISIPDLKQETITTSRTVTNVGSVNAVYKAVLQSPLGVEMAVEPTSLVFNANSKTHSFKITFKSSHKVQGDYAFGSLTWVDDGAHSVRIPIAVRPVIQDFYADAS